MIDLPFGENLIKKVVVYLLPEAGVFISTSSSVRGSRSGVFLISTLGTSTSTFVELLDGLTSARQATSDSDTNVIIKTAKCFMRVSLGTIRYFFSSNFWPSV